MGKVEKIDEIICTIWENVQERIEKGYSISSEKALCFLFSMELIKKTGFDIEIDFENQCYNDLQGSSRYLDLLVKYTDISIAIEFKFPTKSQKGNSNKAEVRKAVYRDLARLEYLKKDNIADRCYFLMATNETSYINEGKHRKYVTYKTHEGYEITQDVTVEIDNLKINKQSSFKWENTRHKGKKHIIVGKYAWLSPIKI
ncbi:hypothetical protein BZG01_21230 [Labilibaculum manganireducens]|uniref:Uncharacterized protein n=1 Tax=Labilibaculum manganireducens TaxID=1940525 RepID=A0A2N3HQ59_9BACT|nr:hypothetical protein [Labilibaculum manganireducens]PKQ60177.1 hypothetical protein BZG01_21230 [Labilibaculum manganireducens]